jgi:uridine kinase
MRMRIFVTCDNDIRFCRRVHRDIRERGRTYNGVVKQYLRFVRPSYHDFIEPTMQHANLIIPSTTNNYECVEFIVQNLLAITRSYTDINSK